MASGGSRGGGADRGLRLNEAIRAGVGGVNRFHGDPLLLGLRLAAADDGEKLPDHGAESFGAGGCLTTQTETDLIDRIDHRIAGMSLLDLGEHAVEDATHRATVVERTLHVAEVVVQLRQTRFEIHPRAA